MIPSEAKRYLVQLDNGCVDWKGRKYYGRPAWTLWMQRAVWEDVNGALPKKSTVSETCTTHGCLNAEHLQMRAQLPRVPKTQCRRCGGILSRDVNNKTYCQQCNALRNRLRRRSNVQD